MNIKVDKDKLRVAFETPINEISEDLLKEVSKVFSIVIAKYYSKYYYMADELKAFAMLAFLERHDRYDHTRDPYGYLYTVFRNEVGNKIRGLTKETSTDDGSDEKHNVSVVKTLTSLMKDKANIPVELEKYQSLLSGEDEFTMVRIPKKDVLPLMVYLKSHEHVSMSTPEFVLKSDVKALYSLLKDLLDIIYG